MTSRCRRTTLHTGYRPASACPSEDRRPLVELRLLQARRRTTNDRHTTKTHKKRHPSQLWRRTTTSRSRNTLHTSHQRASAGPSEELRPLVEIRRLQARRRNINGIRMSKVHKKRHIAQLWRRTTTTDCRKTTLHTRHQPASACPSEEPRPLVDFRRLQAHVPPQSR